MLPNFKRNTSSTRTLKNFYNSTLDLTNTAAIIVHHVCTPTKRKVVFANDGCAFKLKHPLYMNRITGCNNSICMKKRQRVQMNLDEISPVEEENNIVRNEVLLEPLCLDILTKKPAKRVSKHGYNYKEHKKNVRLMIMYSFLIFGLLIIVFCTLYLR